jgi:hypothetical protein
MIFIHRSVSSCIVGGRRWVLVLGIGRGWSVVVVVRRKWYHPDLSNLRQTYYELGVLSKSYSSPVDWYLLVLFFVLGIFFLAPLFPPIIMLIPYVSDPLKLPAHRPAACLAQLTHQTTNNNTEERDRDKGPR